MANVTATVEALDIGFCMLVIRDSAGREWRCERGHPASAYTAARALQTWLDETDGGRSYAWGWAETSPAE